jgi:hypothetical protein
MVDPVTAAAKIVYAAGRRHHWSGFDRPYEQLDPIGLSEFNAIIERALAAADGAREDQRLTPSHWFASCLPCCPGSRFHDAPEEARVARLSCVL